MGKRITSRKRGKGSSRYRSPSHRFLTKIKYIPLSEKTLTGTVTDLVNCPGHTAPLAEISYDNGTKGYLFATEKMFVGDKIAIGREAIIKNGNVLPLGLIPEGASIVNIEGSPGDGGKFVRSSGVFAKILAKTDKTALVNLPSKKQKEFNLNCRATIGVLAGGGRKEKPFVKAGKKWHAMRARGRLYPKTAAVAMNAFDHPFGSGRGRHEGKSTVPPRNAPPGRNVGQIRARRTGRKR
ncbi:MAG: 50S ribosomal protein L2 [Nanoarchaeota archaeon]|nr:50S ribosomal protein L2 [Nanoarchaeota archaeon]